ncbi:MAG: zinc-ribbon domain-containing protein [Oscillospiraceae bacterium]|nr:zinc-ribbon domain-containing protein [Oscillospiraceae bacterium]
MSYCTQCGTEIPDSANFCPGCGAPCGYTPVSNPQPVFEPQTATPVHPKRERKKSTSIAVGIGVILLLLTFAVISTDSGENETSSSGIAVEEIAVADVEPSAQVELAEMVKPDEAEITELQK